MNRSDFLTLATSVSGNSSAANVYFANDGLNIYFFTFNPSRKATQIAFNPHVQCV
jgi:1,4-dihydroxy-2-naphthoate octaprenyltransferase